MKEATAKAISGGFEDTDEREMELWRALHQIYSAADAAKAAGAPAASEAGISVVVAGVDSGGSRSGGSRSAAGGEDEAGRVPLGSTDPNAGGEGEEGENDEELLMLCGSGSDASSAIAVQRDVNKALVSALQVHMGQLKLRTEHPSTAFFGNGDVLKTVRRLGESLGIHVSGRTFMGKGLKGAKCVSLDSNDSLETQEAQWRAFVNELARSDTALLMHMTNHCACPPLLSLHSPPIQELTPLPPSLNPYADSCILLSSQIA